MLCHDAPIEPEAREGIRPFGARVRSLSGHFSTALAPEAIVQQHMAQLDLPELGRHGIGMERTINALHRLGGVGRRADLLAVGATQRSIQRAAREGEIVVIGRGVFCLPGMQDEPLTWAVRTATSLTCVSAAELHGLWLFERPGRPHVMCNHGRAIPRVVVHRGKRSGYIAPVLDAVVCAIRCQPRLRALVIAESAVVKGLIAPDDLHAQFGGLRDPSFRLLISEIDPRSMSIIETLARTHLRDAGFLVEPQKRIPGVGHVDLWVEGFLAIELEGFTYHSRPAELQEDRRRSNALALLGVPYLRYGTKTVLHAPEHMISEVRSLVSRSR